MKSIGTVLLFLITICLHAQGFEDYISTAGNLYDEANYTESAKVYTQALNMQEGNASQYYNAACSWALTGDTIQSIQYLKQSAEKGWKNLKHLNRDKDIKSLHGVSGWAEIQAMVQANLEEYEKDFDKPLKEKLEAIYIKDQMLRQLLGEVEEKWGSDSDEMKFFWSLINHQDSINEAVVVSIIEEKGWPGTNLVGGQANSCVWLVIQHAPLETQEKYLPLLRESVKKGESRGSNLALLEDRIQMRNGKPQIYGSQITTNQETGEQMVYEIKDPEYVNQRRREVGLGPIQDYVKHWGIEWTVEQKEK